MTESVRRDDATQIAGTNRVRLAARAEEASSVAKLQQEYGAKIAARTNKLAELVSAQASELSTALQAHQQEHLNNFLRRYRLSDAVVHGLVPRLISSLFKNGVVTEADVSHRSVLRVSGIGPAKAAELMRWRRRLEALTLVPATLPDAVREKIVGRSHSLRAVWESEQMQLRGQLQQEVATAQAKCNSILRAQDLLDKDIRLAADSRIAQISRETGRKKAELSEKINKVRSELQVQQTQQQAAISTARSQLVELEWQKGVLTRKLCCYDRLTFRRYLLRVFRK
jgi:DNA-binding helix-hairpin-helix protein with protein kinase domain